MNYSKLTKEKQISKHLKKKYHFKKNTNFPWNKQSPLTNLLQYKGSCKWCCKECNLIFKTEKEATEHFLGKKYQHFVKNKILCNIRCWKSIKQIHKMTNGKQMLFVNKKFHNVNTGNLPVHKNLKVKSTFYDIIPTEARRDNILSTVIKNEKGSFSSADLSIYRTPSGKYYCQSCDLSVNSQAQFLQHIESRKHRHKANKSAYKLK